MGLQTAPQMAAQFGGLSDDARAKALVKQGTRTRRAGVAALVRVLSDRALAERMGQAGRAVALVELTDHCAVERFVRLYERLL